MEQLLDHFALAILAAALVEIAKGSYRHFQHRKNLSTKDNIRRGSDES
jgi:hypothetical protein